MISKYIYFYKKMYEVSNTYKRTENINIFSCNQMHTNYKPEEFAVRKFIKHRISSVTPGILKFIIYYRKWKSSKHIVPKRNQPTESNVVVTNNIPIPMPSKRHCYMSKINYLYRTQY